MAVDLARVAAVIDRAFPLERFFAERMNATTVEIDSGHISLVTHP